MKRIGFAGSDARTFLSALTVSRSGEKGEFQGVVIRGMPAMKPYAELAGWPVDFLEVPGGSSVQDYAARVLRALSDDEIDYVVPMPEALQIDGFVDRMTEAGFGDRVAGLTAAASFIEGDKVTCKQLCASARVPVAPDWVAIEARHYQPFLRACLRYLEQHGGAYAKYPFQAAGKGARFIGSPWEIREVYETLMADYAESYRKLLGPGLPWPLLMESYMAGIEVSFTALVDVHGNFQILPTAMDYQGRFAGQISRNNPVTGGMASLGPHPVHSQELLEMAVKQVFRPLIEEMRRRGILRPCILYPGCMVFFNEFGKPASIRVCEINIRPPEPEFQVMLRLVRNFGQLIMAMFEGHLDEVKPDVRDDQIAMTIALVTGPGPGGEYKGYPWRHKPGEPMMLDLKGLKKNNVTLLPAGMGYKDGTFISDGTRVAYLIGNATVKPGENRGQVADALRDKLYRMFADGKVRTIPCGTGEDPQGNRLTVRDDVGIHFGIAERLFAI
ncbi:MAG: hypothetical protein A2760_01315 [Candidatus Doudnabacteria bacterium RIFCSPHIGHO2_01_FULL_50_67]|uniref:ATP-grasp domain-containing protein n=1 Tax=Candidatus Doudnabacteria bacterium RIFCSPHIGHO2_12_FULL_48_16 TaxID=1817838 RepID=A0A1F5PL77_9BACT|nr:MAG: hypothetical protein A3B77_00960 [Candidatus Doudnabacteria bacterium RIFCSPHIGHO2_02_FULL_49_24]OGE88812.1 MAG: hypothetical protein A2760_01315 [Candidatus Doudnabacteria bacterium RIFCSPHIGHO2_01_FULL_50_67]OGE90666.1 MAG: hypothetical protein A3E29_00850 [Candidatus Doudnabacteria bacterium RIFCSPHIGHO2_12_FULL_48_16]OGE96998.1 MAG: hypothetical protein A2990_02875 [Candidatus Doudnabacteria bacterium RIFCSPLOWO2_01_FULL_49_40]